jgi:hypothetical protein
MVYWDRSVVSEKVVRGSRGSGATASSSSHVDVRHDVNGFTMSRFQKVVPSYSAISGILHAWNSALATASASRGAEHYARVVALVMESLDRYATVHDLIEVYCAPDIGLKSRVLALCGDGDIQLQPQVVLGAACALRLRQLMDAAIA